MARGRLLIQTRDHRPGPDDLRSRAALPLHHDLDDPPPPCRWCPGWFEEIVPGPDGRLLRREWHRPTCPTYLDRR
ncbi:hypothetical protein HMPREF0063_10115 [Aeromicrobium marinum DSM 15272]|uniref:Uncharacterized protein n=1 Tax=Aeromicrobium marinum DSM 15272 TaxID=585531 RepID=E2S7V8_9ACTN|nr:hypothetical protein HMPREF0063_10115 [Aeromicrobium marinum DSM 15272]